MKSEYGALVLCAISASDIGQESIARSQFVTRGVSVD